MAKDGNDFRKEITAISEKVELKLAKNSSDGLFVCSPESGKIRAVLTANLILYWLNRDEKVLLVETGESETYADTFDFVKDDHSELYQSKMTQLFMIKANQINYRQSLAHIFENTMKFDKIIVDVSSHLSIQNFSLLVASAQNILLVTKEKGNKKKMREQLRMIDNYSKIIGYVSIK